MASRLTDAHIEAQARLRALTVRAVERIWADLPGYDRRNVDQWLSQTLPVVDASKRASVALTDAFVAQFLGRRALGVNAAQVRTRNGVDLAEVYERPFVTVWTALGAGKLYADAVAAGSARAGGLAAFEVQSAMRSASAEVQAADDGIYGYQRVANPGSCAFCSSLDGVFVKSADAMPLHNNCGCGLEPLTSPHSRAASLPSGVAVEQHGEMGAVLVDPAHSFTSPAALT